MNGLLKRAVESRQKLEMIYISKEGVISQRVIKVLAVSDVSIKAYCYTKKKYRTFKLTNILSVGPLRIGREA